MRRALAILFLSVGVSSAQSVPSPEFGSDIDIKTLLNDWSAQSGHGTISPLLARVNQATTGRVVATWDVVGVLVPTWSGLLSATNRTAAAARKDAYNERSALREIRTNTAASIDSMTNNIAELKATSNLSTNYTPEEARVFMNIQRREMIDIAQELKTALQQIQALRKYESER